MTLYTKNNDPIWDRTVYLYEENDLFTESINDKDTCKIIYLDSGTIDIMINEEHFIGSAPLLLCLNEKDIVKVIESNAKGVTLYFRPNVLNDLFTKEAINEKSLNLIGTTLYQDFLLLKPFYGIDGEEIKIMYLAHSSLPNLKKLFRSINDELTLQKDTFWPCRSRSYFIELLFLINTFQNKPITPLLKDFGSSNEEILVGRIITFLNENLAKKITIETITKAFGLNRNLLNEYFTKVAGKTVINYLIDIRMSFATSLLRETEIPIEEVASRCGYNDVSYFSKVFKGYSGKNPKSLRNL